MKLLELEINNFRGVKQLKIEPQGKNFLIWGPNGSGKSTVVDSLDFLLTGNVSRMTGKGTKDITIKKHAPHIDSEVDDVEIKALVQLQNLKDPLEIRRSLKSPKKLIYNPNFKEYIEPVLELATRGQHVLTRREILNYITADSSTRARQIEKLLKLDEVEKTRNVLNRTRNQLKNEYTSAKGSLKNSIESIKNIIDDSVFEEKKVLNFINKQRKVLNADKIDDLDYSIIKNDVEPPGTPRENYVNLNLLEKSIQKLEEKLSSEHLDHVSQLNESLKALNHKIASNPQLNETIDRLKLTELGLNLVDESGACPLCNTSWEREELQDVLKKQIESLSNAKEDLQEIEDKTEELIGIFNSVSSLLDEIISSAKILELEKQYHELNSWQDNLKPLLDADHYSKNNFKTELLLAPSDISNILQEIRVTAQQNSPEPSEEQIAWDTLTKLEDQLKNYYSANDNCCNSYESYKKAETLLAAFIESRDSILGNLFSEIEDRFIELYRELHSSDESAFMAKLKPKGGGVDFYVDFHGRGIHPPHALHSEGHQDSMGICLYLALAERLTEGYIDLIILDDVMMSVDAPHRREICHLLAGFFKGRQFFITTHDQTWARQLKLEGVISSKGMIELYNWSIENGPYINSTLDMWEKIDDDLDKNDVHSAAFKLRRGSEEFFRTVCNSLGAPVTFKENQKWELGDFLPAAKGRYNDLLKKAKIAADSWKNQDEVMRLKAIEKNSKNAFYQSQVEQWAVNINVHYNNWANFSVEDFRPVVDAFYDLFGVFQCDNCGGVLHLSKNGMDLEAVRCNCGGVNWNLVRK